MGSGNHGAVGAFVAYNSGAITQSYTTGDTGGLNASGGFVLGNTGTINESFATGHLGIGGPAAPTSYSSIAVSNSGTINSNVYWNADNARRGYAVGYNFGTAPPDINGLTTAQMSTPSNFVGWNFGLGGAWAMPAGATHPVLQWQQSKK